MQLCVAVVGAGTMFFDVVEACIDTIITKPSVEVHLAFRAVSTYWLKGIHLDLKTSHFSIM